MARDFESFVSYWNAFEGRWYSIWTETDFRMVISAFHSINVVSWKIINRRLNCLDQFKNTSFTIFYISEKGMHMLTESQIMVFYLEFHLVERAPCHFVFFQI